jgi:hypothetical protein
MGFAIEEYIAIEDKRESRLVAAAHIPPYSNRLGNDVTKVTEQMLSVLEGRNVIAVIGLPQCRQWGDSDVTPKGFADTQACEEFIKTAEAMVALSNLFPAAVRMLQVDAVTRSRGRPGKRLRRCCRTTSALTAS